MEEIVKNQENILIIVGAVVTIASVIVKLTPNKTDNKIVEIALNILNILAINNKKRNEGK
jgi:hypothetical protein